MGVFYYIIDAKRKQYFDCGKHRGEHFRDSFMDACTAAILNDRPDFDECIAALPHHASTFPDQLFTWARSANDDDLSFQDENEVPWDAYNSSMLPSTSPVRWWPCGGSFYTTTEIGHFERSSRYRDIIRPGCCDRAAFELICALMKEHNIPCEGLPC